MHKPTRRIATLAALVLGLGLSLPASAADVQISHGGIKLNGNLELADGRTVADGVVLITHGTLAHGRMELTQSMQEFLKDRGVSSLAITLSYGLDNRSGMYDCAVPHTHRHGDAVAEIGAWVGWLKSQGARSVAVLGHSRGADQTAWYAAEQRDPVVGKVLLLAPVAQDASGISKDYQKRFNKDVAPVVERARALLAKGDQGPMKPVDILYCADTAATPESVISYHAYDPRFGTLELVGKIDVPVLVIMGSADDVTPDLDKVFAPRLSPGKVDLVVVDGADHFFRDLYGEEVADAVVKFVGKP